MEKKKNFLKVEDVNLKLEIQNTFLEEKDFILIVGPCAVESEEQALEIASFIKDFGISFFRAGIYKPRTSPYTFQGLEEKGFSILQKIKSKFNFLICSEIMDVRQIENSLDYIDIIQVGARNMQNYSLLKELGKLKKPVILKRGFSATIEEWILSAEYILHEGNKNVIFCERGIRTFENSTRNTLDFSSILVLKERTKLPIIVDPSHASGNRNYIINLSKAAVAVGADGLLIDVYKDPDNALVDGKQSLNFLMFKEMFLEVSKMLLMMNKNLFKIH